LVTSFGSHLWWILGGKTLLLPEDVVPDRKRRRVEIYIIM
jgi:hypothetical protein